MKYLNLLAATLLLAACGSDDTGEPGVEAERPAASERAPTVGAELADELQETMDRAKNVEVEVMQQKDAIDKALREAQGDP